MDQQPNETPTGNCHERGGDKQDQDEVDGAGRSAVREEPVRGERCGEHRAKRDQGWTVKLSRFLRSAEVRTYGGFPVTPRPTNAWAHIAALSADTGTLTWDRYALGAVGALTALTGRKKHFALRECRTGP
jgi:hypothetical protein